MSRPEGFRLTPEHSPSSLPWRVLRGRRPVKSAVSCGKTWVFALYIIDFSRLRGLRDGLPVLLVVAPRVRALGIPGPAPGAPMAPSCSAAPRACAPCVQHAGLLVVALARAPVDSAEALARVRAVPDSPGPSRACAGLNGGAPHSTRARVARSGGGPEALARVRLGQTSPPLARARCLTGRGSLDESRACSPFIEASARACALASDTPGTPRVRAG